MGERFRRFPLSAAGRPFLSALRPIYALFVAPLAAAAFLLAACDGEEGARSAEGGRPAVRAATTLPLFADFLRQVAGDRVEVFALLPAGADPHTYEPVPRDVQRLAQVDIVVVNGMDLEPAALRVIRANVSSSVTVVELAEEARAAGAQAAGPDDDHGETNQDHDDADDGHPEDGERPEDEHAHGEGDPHLWMDIDNARVYARIIRDRLSEIDPGGARLYQSNLERYEAELDELEDYVRSQTSAVPPENRRLVTTHDAFGYFAHSIGFEIAFFVVAGPGREPGPEHVADLARSLRDTGVPAVFVEPQISVEGGILERAARDAGVQVCTLYSDSLDDDVKSYVELMRFNADELARCLGGAGAG